MRATCFLALLLLPACTSIGGAESRYVEGTINRYEWASANWLTLDLTSGRFSIRPGTYNGGYAEGEKRIDRQSGSLEAARLEILNGLVDDVMVVGLQDAACLAIPGSERTLIVVSTGGRKEIKVRDNQNSYSARDELVCWTDEGNALYEFLEEEFEWASGLRAFDERLKER
ncbi:MAG: hypothetical protein AAF697_03760 [Pseudomonadota bacterium]